MKDFDSNFIDDGFVDLGPVLDKTKCRELLEKVYETRSFGPELFIDEKQHRINPKWSKNNPGPGINLTEKFNLDFIENDDSFKNSMVRVLGPDYKIMLKKFVVGVPNSWLPKWVNNETENLMDANLATWIKPEFQDMTYFRGLDFHQDFIDHKSRFSDFITLYVYLDNVDMKMSPLVVIPKSHMRSAQNLGAKPATAFWKVYLPQTIPGMSAGGLLVFVLAIGYFITPELVGGKDGKLIGSWIAYHLKTTLNWGLCAALGAILLGVMLIFYWLYNKIVGIDNIKLG